MGGLINRGEGGGAPRNERGPTGLNSRGGPLGLANLGLGSPTDFFCSDWKNKNKKIVQLKKPIANFEQIIISMFGIIAKWV